MHGRQLGRELGFPTANMEVAADADTIESGVYESYVEIDGVEYKAMSNLGSNPSVGGGPRHLETHIFDFSGDLYGRRLRVELRRKIRDERKFDSLEELQRQIERDRSCILSSENRRRGDDRAAVYAVFRPEAVFTASWLRFSSAGVGVAMRPTRADDSARDYV